MPTLRVVQRYTCIFQLLFSVHHGQLFLTFFVCCYLHSAFVVGCLPVGHHTPITSLKVSLKAIPNMFVQSTDYSKHVSTLFNLQSAESKEELRKELRKERA